MNDERQRDTDTPTASTEATAKLAELTDQRARAATRVDELERDWRAAVTAVHDASAAVAEAERVGTSASKRNALEERLAAAKARAAEPWPERVEGSKAAVRDAAQAVRAFVAEHLAELVEGAEADGRIAAEKVNEAAAALVAAVGEREAVAASLGALITQVASPSPADVTRSRAEEVARAATALIEAGGEEPARVRRDREPWSRLVTHEVETVPA